LGRKVNSSILPEKELRFITFNFEVFFDQSLLTSSSSWKNSIKNKNTTKNKRETVLRQDKKNIIISIVTTSQI
jgi:hypothetical protein